MPSSSLQALLARAESALDRGRGAEAAQLLAPALRSSLTRDDELAVRSALAEAWLLQDDVDQASAALGRPPDTFRDTVAPGRLSTLWRLHGRVASSRGDQSRAIALHGRALKQAEVAHDSRAIGLAHYELGQCYKQVGDVAIVHEHITKAASALHAAGDRRHLALVHSLSGVLLAQSGATTRRWARCARRSGSRRRCTPSDVLATVCGNQANVTMLQHRYEQALALAERSVTLHEEHGSGHGLAVALATLGQICVRLGDLARAEQALHRALEVRSPIQFHETSGAVFDTLAQIQLIRGRYDTASEYLARAGEAYGAYGRQTSRWYEWSVRVLSARLALRRGAPEEALALADEILPRGRAALRRAAGDAHRRRGAHRRQSRSPKPRSGARPPPTRSIRRRRPRRGASTSGCAACSTRAAAARPTRITTSRRARRCSTCSASATRPRSATSRSAGSSRRPARARSPSAISARRKPPSSSSAPSATWPTPPRRARLLSSVGTGEYVISPADADDAIVRRIVDAAALPDLLGRETAAALFEAAAADCSVVYVELPGGDVRVIAAVGCDPDAARTLARSAAHGTAYGRGALAVEPIGRDPEGPRFGLVASPRPIGHTGDAAAADDRRGRAAGLRALRGARSIDRARRRLPVDRSLEPLLPGLPVGQRGDGTRRWSRSSACRATI